MPGANESAVAPEALVSAAKALQIELLIPLIPALLGIFLDFRMTRMPDPEQPAAAEEMVLG